MTPWSYPGHPPARRGSGPLIMGILNVTPDSFSDGGRWSSVDQAVARAEQMAAEGAAIIDVGGESTRPGAEVVPSGKELARILPVIEGVRRRVDRPVSVDTTKPDVARAAIEAGASIVNDISGLQDPEMASLVANSTVGVVLMHIRGTPRDMQDAPHYDDVVVEVFGHLADRARMAESLGIGRGRVCVDPGIGFGKSFDHNIALLRALPDLVALGYPVLVGTSRKGFLGKITGRQVLDRVHASVASALAAAQAGASVVRVHDVAATADAFRVWEAQHGWPDLTGTA